MSDAGIRSSICSNGKLLMRRKIGRNLCFMLVTCFFLYACAPTIRLGPGSFLADLDTKARIEEKVKRKHPSYANKDLSAMAVDPETKDTTRSALEEQFAEMLAQCKTILSTYEQQSQTLAIISVTMAIVGAAAGAIAVPALTAAAPVANKAAISAFGGISGVTNTAQGAMKKEGLTSEEAR